MSEPYIVGTHDANTLAQLAEVAKTAEHVALMADGHLGYLMPVGGVAAYRNKVSIAGVGYDISCGNCAIETDLPVDRFSRSELEGLADEINSTISFGVGRKNKAADAPVDHPLFEHPAWDGIPANARQGLRDKARAQLGTVGSGNHYVDVLAGDRRLWVGVHFGSRGFGHTVASGFLALAAGESWGARVPETETLLDLDQPLGHDYYELMKLAGKYAYAGREWVTRKVVEIMGGHELDLVHNHHNFAWKERHFGEEFVVVRKGATPAWAGERGFVGGSMGDCSVILQGADPDDKPAEVAVAIDAAQQCALFSTVHGAGRVMSRTEAAGKVKKRHMWVCGQRDCTGRLPIQAPLGPDRANPKCPACGSKTHRQLVSELVRPGKVTPEMMAEWLGREGVILRGGGLDESPHAYRRLPDVLAAQGGTIEVLEVLHPLIVVMAGADEHDPYKD